MVILKIATGTEQEREVEIVTERGIWDSGNYMIFEAHFFKEGEKTAPEPHDTNSPAFLGLFIIDKEKDFWAFKGSKLSHEEQEQVAKFILDYQPPDGVY